MFALHSQRTPVRAKVVTILGLVCFSLVLVSTSHAQDEGAPAWGKFLKRFGKDKLLKPPFAEAAETTPKGLAAKIRARELDVPNRIKAVEYLSTLDCRQFPEARDMLITAMQEDKWERVRFAAAKGLRDMIERNGCNNANGNGAECKSGSASIWDQCVEQCSKAASKTRRGEKRVEEDCHCKTCCDEETLNALAKTAYEMDEAGCPFEPSQRVREMAVEAISVCGIPCHYQPYYATSDEIAPAPAVEPEMENPEKTQGTPNVDGGLKIEVEEPKVEEPKKIEVEVEVKEAQLPPLPRVTVTQPEVRTTVVPTPIAQLDKICIVSWRNGETVAPSAEFESVHKGRLYHFASAECKAAFDESPEMYAVAYGGCDPVHYLKTREPLVGRYLADCDGRFYLFASHENLEEFNSHPEIYAPGQKRTVRVASNEESR